MAEFPALPIWTDAYLADTGHLNDAEHGLYFQLIMLLWRSPGCKIPNDDTWIGRRFPGRLAAVRNIIAEFCGCDGNWITQKKLAKEFEYLKKRRQKQSDRAKARWDKEKDLCRGNAASGNALSTPTPTPTQVRKIVEVAQKTERLKQGTHLEVFWKPSVEGKLFADERIGADRATEELDKFRDYWLAVPGAKGRKLDWDRTWRNWIRNSKTGAFNGRDRSLKQRYADALQKLGSEAISEDVVSLLPQLKSG